MPTYQPGDVLRDSGGYPAVIHYGEGASSTGFSSHELFLKALDGRVSLEDYSRIVMSHVEVKLAYSSGSELPEGATVTNEPDRLLYA
jgi:hypothetical protein